MSLFFTSPATNPEGLKTLQGLYIMFKSVT